MKFLAFDVETHGDEPMFALQPCRLRQGTARLTSFAIARGQPGQIKTAAQLYPDKEDLRAMLVGAKAAGATIVGWNMPFDVAWLIAMGLRDEVYACTWADAMLMYKHLTMQPTILGRKPYGLKQAVADHWPDEAGYEEDIDFNDLSVEALGKLGEYNQRDAEFTLRLAHAFWRRMSDKMRRAVGIEAACIPLVAESMLDGIHVDPVKAKALADKLEGDANVAYVKLALAEDTMDPKILASPKQLRELLFKKWGLTPKGMTDGGEASTDRDTLVQLSFEDPRAAWINDYREAMNNRTKFCQGLLTSHDYNGDGVVRPTPRIVGTYTGRLSYTSKTGKGAEEVATGVPIHQWKRGKAFRELITAPPGYTLIEFDFAGQEYRWMAVESNDPVMLQMCAPGEDGHAFLGAKIAGVDYRAFQRMLKEDEPTWKPKRQFGKVGNLSCAYRTSPPTLQVVARTQHKIDMSLQEAKAVHGTYLGTYAYVRPYWKRQIKFGRHYGFVETLAGRRVNLGTEFPEDKKWGLESTCINFPIQGIGADQKYLAMAVLRDLLPRFDGRFYFELHDGLYSIVPNHRAEAAAHELSHVMSNLPYYKAWGVKLPIAFPVDVKMGPSWGEMMEVHA